MLRNIITTIIILSSTSLVGAETDAIYKWEPLLNIQYEGINNVLSGSVLLSKTYYKRGSTRTVLRGSRGRKSDGLSRKLGIGGSLIYFEKWRAVPFIQWRVTYRISHNFYVLASHRFHLDVDNKHVNARNKAPRNRQVNSSL